MLQNSTNMNKIILVVLTSISSLILLAKENVGTFDSNSQNSLARVAADCTPSQAMTDLNINNVRTTIMGGGDMWWNLSDARYEIPKNRTRTIKNDVLYLNLTCPFKNKQALTCKHKSTRSS